MRAWDLPFPKPPPPPPPGVSVLTEVLQQAPRLVLGRKGRELLAGVPQLMLLTVHAGTTAVEQVGGAGVK